MGLDIFSSIVVIITITMIVVNIGGLMYWWNITLNAVSLVNLVMVSTFKSCLKSVIGVFVFVLFHIVSMIVYSLIGSFHFGSKLFKELFDQYID